ncbi:MAG: YkvA family protein [Candidatus Binatia bacterium]
MPSTSSNSLSTLQFLRLLWHLPSFAKLYWQLFNDQRVPLRAKAILIAAVVYLLSPFDFIPELLTPIFGVVDDIAVLLIAARWFISLCPPEVVEERVKEISKMN